MMSAKEDYKENIILQGEVLGWDLELYGSLDIDGETISGRIINITSYQDTRGDIVIEIIETFSDENGKSAGQKELYSGRVVFSTLGGGGMHQVVFIDDNLDRYIFWWCDESFQLDLAAENK